METVLLQSLIVGPTVLLIVFTGVIENQKTALVFSSNDDISSFIPGYNLQERNGVVSGIVSEMNNTNKEVSILDGISPLWAVGQEVAIEDAGQPSKLLATDHLLVNRGGASFHCTGADFSDYFEEPAFWVMQNVASIVSGAEENMFDGNNSTFCYFAAADRAEYVIIDFRNAAGDLPVNGYVEVKVDSDGTDLDVSLGGVSPTRVNGLTVVRFNNINFVSDLRFRRTGGQNGSGSIYWIKINGQFVTMANKGQGLANP